MLAREETPRLLARALFRLLDDVAGRPRPGRPSPRRRAGAALVLRSALSVVVVVAVLVLTPALLYVRCQRSARAYAPPGFTLGPGTRCDAPRGPARRRDHGDPVRQLAVGRAARGRRDPAHPAGRRPPVARGGSCSPRWRRCRPSSGPRPERRHPLRRPATRPCRTPTVHSVDTEPAASAATIRQVAHPGMLVLAAVDLLLLVSPLVLHGMPWFWAAFPDGPDPRRRRGGLVERLASPRRVCEPRDGHPSGPARRRPGHRGFDRQATISYRGVDRMFVMRNAVLVRSQLRSVVLFPRAVLPDVEAPSRAGRGGVVQEPSDELVPERHRPPRSPGVWVCRAPGSPLRAGRHPVRGGRAVGSTSAAGAPPADARSVAVRPEARAPGRGR